MLFKALLRRLNGGTDTASTKIPSSHRQSSKLVYERFSNIPELILRLLQHRQVNDGPLAEPAHKIFPALEIIERSGIPSQHEAKVQELLRQYTESPDWSIREKAAKAQSRSLTNPNIYLEASAILNSHAPMSQCALHGRLLFLKSLIVGAEVPVWGERLRK